MQSQRWRRAVCAAKNFARSPLPTLAVWIGDALSGLTLDVWGRALAWRIRRQASSLLRARALVDALLIAAVVALLVWGLS